LRAGGVPFYAGGTFARLGRPCRITTKYNPADAVITAALKLAGVSVTEHTSRLSTTFQFEDADGEIGEPILAAEGDPITCSEVDFSLSAAVYFAPLTPRDVSPDCYGAAKEAGNKVFLDAQGITRQEPSPENRSAAYAILSQVDVVKVTAAEAMWLFGTDQPRELLTEFRQLGVEEVALTAGVEGSLVLSQGEITKVAARVVSAADKVGCGDIYFASYIDARLTGHAPGVAGQHASDFVARWLLERGSTPENTSPAVSARNLV
jgi:sugar/nucleoside kinase (ribokinase family)